MDLRRWVPVSIQSKFIYCSEPAGTAARGRCGPGRLHSAGNGVILTMGKGGVGKTTLAAALAIGLVDRGHAVTLSTTDPAAHLADARTSRMRSASCWRDCLQRARIQPFGWVVNASLDQQPEQTTDPARTSGRGDCPDRQGEAVVRGPHGPTAQPRSSA